MDDARRHELGVSVVTTSEEVVWVVTVGAASAALIYILTPLSVRVLRAIVPGWLDKQDAFEDAVRATRRLALMVCAVVVIGGLMTIAFPPP